MICLGSTTPTARKRHFCDSCCGSIEPGEKYFRARMVDGGEAWVWKAHLPCEAAGQALWKAGIEGDEGSILRVCDMDREDIDFLAAQHPQIHAAIWGRP